VPKNKFILIVVVALVGVLGAYKFVLAKPAPAGAEPKVKGAVYVLPKEFLVNLSDGRYAKFSFAMVLDHLPEAGGHGESPPEGYGLMPEEAVVRDLVTDVVGASTGDELSDAEGREKVKKQVKRRLKQRTDLHIEDVLLPDITVQ
jgi:flagellar FliL protein